MNEKVLSIDTIGLSVRATNSLHRAGIHTVEDLLNCSEESLFSIKNIGKKTIDEIIKKTKEYKDINKGSRSQGQGVDFTDFSIPGNFEKWITDSKNQKFVIGWLKQKDLRIETLELLSARAFNLLMFAGYDYLYQLAFLSQEDLMKIPRVDALSASEIEKLITRCIKEMKEDIFDALTNNNIDACPKKKPISIYELLNVSEYHDTILQYVRANDIEIEQLGLTNRPKNRLISNGYSYLSDIIFMTRSDLQKIQNMGTESARKILEKINTYLARHEAKIKAAIYGDKSACFDDEAIKNAILDQYKEIGFHGLSLNDIEKRLLLPEQFPIEKLKNIIGQLIATEKLEYIDYRCYRVYGTFNMYVDTCPDIDHRSRDFIRKRLAGKTLTAIAQENGLSKERVRQIINDGIIYVKNYYSLKTELKVFDEDYYKYLYETYAFDKKDGIEWLGIPAYVWNYLDLTDIKRGKKDLQEALDDHRLDAGLRIKIKNYLNSNNLFIDGMWIRKKRGDLEQLVARKLCSCDVSYNEFCHLYNTFLEQEEIPYDENIYYSDGIWKSRKNHLASARFLLWKQNEQLRYYDIDARDYTELLNTLNLDSYENIELSTVKFMHDFPELMEKYDIHDHYELHNLLRKIVPEGRYHDFHCGRMPQIKFGVFDRDKAIFDILIDNAPISASDLAELISEEYGYDPVVVMANYLQNFTVYYNQGMYSVDYKQMSVENRLALKTALINDFYYIDEIRKIYSELIPEADVEEINPYNLKTMGFIVYTRYAIQNHSSLDAFFHNILTKEDIIDLSIYRKRYVYVQSFSMKLMELKRSLQIVEFEPNKIVNFKKLEQAGITRDMIQDFCDAVYDFVPDDGYFSVKSLRLDGFNSKLYDSGFSDWFYANLMISDNRFSFGMMFGTIILYKGKADITIKSFETKLIHEYNCVDVFDLMSELKDKYGCKVSEKIEVTYKLQGTEIYYDKILDRLYANKDLYYKELEEAW